MPLASYTVERYRSFARRTTVEVRPLTLLFGYNSAGKSALLRALPLLAASAGGANVGPLALDAEVARDATYAEIRSRITARNDLVLAVAWDDAEPVREIELHFRDDDKRHILGELIARDMSGAAILHATDVPGDAGRYQIEQPGTDPCLTPLSFDGVRPSVRANGPLSEAARTTLDACSLRLRSLQDSVHWLGAVRASPLRKASYRGDPARLGGDGRRAADKLAYDARGAKKLLPRVSTVLREMFGHALEVRDEGDEFALELEPVEGAPLRVSIVDAGEGVTQVLPVLVLGAMALAGELGPSAVLAIEQPEMHLHPHAERALAKFFGEVVRAPREPRLLVETHSENMLLFMQLAVAKGDLSPDQLSILWIERLENGESDVRPIHLDAQGRPRGWPAGVFSEDVELARDLFLARRNPHP